MIAFFSVRFKDNLRRASSAVFVVFQARAKRGKMVGDWSGGFDMPGSEQSSFLSQVAQVAGAVIKHVPTRGILWGVIGFVLGLVFVGLSFVIGLFVMERGALLLGYLLPIPIAIPFLGSALFFAHGLQRGVARAALAIEQKLGLVRYVIDGVLGLLQKHLGSTVSNLPLQQLESKLKEIVRKYLASPEANAGEGLTAWVLRRAQKMITRRIETYLLAAYRAEQQADGSGGGVSLEKVGARVHAQVSGGLAGIIMSPLNKQLGLFLILYALIGVGWWYWLFLIMRLLTKNPH